MSSKPSSRQAQQRADQEARAKRQKYLLIGGGVVAALLVVAGFVVPTLMPRAPTSTGAAACGNLLTLEDEGRGHLAPGDPVPVYKSNPPTSGTHNPTWYPAGIYDNNTDVTQLIHSLEHGYIILYYNGISQEEINSLVNIQRSDSFKMIVAPYPNMEQKVALVAWAHMQNCDGVNEAVIRSFVAQFRNHGPEQAQ
ncbi:MAG: DUF3105 domain-containing protein [Anaerolineae bacterium]|nr:DUF3105 domain-containing protein [Anaerolineae bacterium]